MGFSEQIARQRAFFQTGVTKDTDYRLQALDMLEQQITAHEKEIYQALQADLGKSEPEAFMSEVGMTLSELRYMKRHLRRFARRKKAPMPLAHFPSKAFVQPEPYGTVLIMSPWNYPFLLTMEPLIDAMAAGNTAVVKPSAYSPNTSRVMAKLISEVFQEEYITMILGGRDTNADLLEHAFDYIFFTGGKTVGRLVMEKAAKHLTPVTLELGGKSPCVVDRTADLKLAARRIVWGKFLNLGQTCVAPDYLLVEETVRQELLAHLQSEIFRQFGQTPLENSSYGKIVNEKHLQRLEHLLKGETVVCGGQIDPASRRLAPTVLDHITLQSPIMQEEVFGPILPVLTFANVDDAVDIIRQNGTPLALYLFTAEECVKQKLLRDVSFGGGCINDTIIHLAASSLPFGGVGQSGMGSYHGKAGFDTFTHYKAIVEKKRLDLPMRYQPYSEKHYKALRFFIR